MDKMLHNSLCVAKEILNIFLSVHEIDIHFGDWPLTVPLSCYIRRQGML